jgi:hypothetical protein
MLYFILSGNIICQAYSRRICFKINMKKTIDYGLFSPLENDTIIIRGSFNQWTGDDFFLEDKDNDGIYRQTFNIESDSGIVHEYKYLIIKSNGKELWEKYPDQNNPPYGNRLLDSTDNKIDVFDFDKYYLGVIGKNVIFSEQEIKNDFMEFRKILEEKHCCLYEYTGKQTFDSLFDTQYKMLTKPMSPIEFFKILTPITAKIGCGHTAVWMPGGFWDCGKNNLFPLKIRFIENYMVAAGSYEDTSVIKMGWIIEEINEVPVSEIIHEMRMNYSADAMNIHFIYSQIERRFPMIYARRFGFKNKFLIKYHKPGETNSKLVELNPASVSSVRSIIFSNFNHPALTMDIVENKVAIMKMPTFIYYDRVSYFINFIDSCFTVIKNKKINNLILDLRGNDGGDPFCAAPLFSYLQNKSEPYFAEPYGKYSELAKPLPLPENHFTGNLYTIIDGRCFSTNGHFCSLLKYHNIGKFVGTESGATFKCNAGQNTEFELRNTKIKLILGRSTFVAAVKGMDKTKPIMPEYYVKEKLSDFLSGKDVIMDYIFELIKM